MWLGCSSERVLLRRGWLSKSSFEYIKLELLTCLNKLSSECYDYYNKQIIQSISIFGTTWHSLSDRKCFFTEKFLMGNISVWLPVHLITPQFKIWTHFFLVFGLSQKSNFWFPSKLISCLIIGIKLHQKPKSYCILVISFVSAGV